MRLTRRTHTDRPTVERLESRQFFSVVTGVIYDTPMTVAEYSVNEARFAARAAALAATPTAPTPPTAPTTPTTPTIPTTPTDPAPTDPLPPVPVASVIRIDAGRGPHTDLSGRTWGRDEGFNGGTVSIAPYEVANTFEDPLYYTRRWGNFDYSLQVPSGSYDVRLHFADPVHTQGGRRKFNVFVENKLVLNRFDVAAYGGGKAALVRSLIVNVTDGSLDLRFRNVIDNAILSAIEVVPRSVVGWTAMTNAPVATLESQAAAVNGKLYVFGGIDATTRAGVASNVYNPDADSWTKLAPMPRPITGAATAGDGNIVWLAGGFVSGTTPNTATKDVWKYDVAKNIWTAGPALPKAIAAAAMVRMGRKMHLIGGVDAAGNDLADHYVFDIDNPQLGWRTSAPLPSGRRHLAGVGLNNKIYAIGGQRGTSDATGNIADVSVYDWVTRKWTAAPSLPAPRSHMGSSSFVGTGNRIFVVGGIGNGDGPSPLTGTSLGDVITFDPTQSTWAHSQRLPAVRKAPVARVLANRLIVTTGSLRVAAPEATTWTLLV